MKRRSLPWLLATPLMAAGSLAAHAVGYLVVSSGSHPVTADLDGGVETIVRASHGPLTTVPMLLGLSAAFLLALVAHRLWSKIKREPGRGIAPPWFFWLPPIAYAAQELVERLIHAEGLPFNPAHEPAFLLALVLQIPFGIVAFLLARLALATAERLARLLRGEPSRPKTHTPTLPLTGRASIYLKVAALASGHSSRSPPLATI